MRSGVTKRHDIAFRCCAVALAIVAAGCTSSGGQQDLRAGADPHQGTAARAAAVQPVPAQAALEMLAPVEREAFAGARSQLNSAVWTVVEPEWALCATTSGLDVPADVGFEVSAYGGSAVYNFEAPSVLREQGGGLRFHGEEVTGMSSEQGAAVQHCNDVVQAVLDGRDPTSPEVNVVRLEAARTALKLTASDASTAPVIYDKVQELTETGQWGLVVDCLRARGLPIDEAESTSPGATLDGLGATITTRVSAAELQKELALARPRVDAYIECSASFYDQLAKALEPYRADTSENQKHALEVLAEALEVLGRGN